MASVEKEWEQIQKKAFTHWINSVLEKRGETLVSIEDDFKTGVKLIVFLEILTGQEELKYTKIARHKLHFIENNNIALNYLRNLGVKDVSISAEEIVDGNLKMLLGMCWVLLRNFGKRQTSGGEKDDGTSFEDGLLKWLQEEIKEYNLEVSNFKTSFNDGKVLLALCHKLHPDSVNYHSLDKSDPVQTSNRAFNIAEEHFKIPSLLNAESLAEGKEKEKSIILYLSLLYHTYTNETEKKKLAGVSETKTLSLQEQITMLEEETTEWKETVFSLQEQVEELTKAILVETEQKEVLNLSKEETIVVVKQEREALKQEKDKLEKEKESMLHENEELQSQLKKSEKQREKLEEMLMNAKKENQVSLDELIKTLSVHLNLMNKWKSYFTKENKEYESDKVQQRKEKEISEMEIYDKLGSIAQELGHENIKLQTLRTEKEEKDAKIKEVTSKTSEKKKKKVEIK